MLNLKTLSIAALTAGTIAMAIPAQAAISSSYKVETRVKVVDLQTEEGLIKIYQQLKDTADKECRVNRPASLAERRMAEICASNLLDDFVNSVGDIRLTRLHGEENAG